MDLQFMEQHKQQSESLSSIPNLNIVQAYSLIQCHYNLQDIANASIEDLMRKVKGLPRSVATSVHNHFHTDLRYIK
jgi:excinuclease UvrABC nuclease subunit